MNQHELEILAKNGMIVSDSLMAHFTQIVPSMSAIGAHRRGSKAIRNATGRKLILDEYVLPDGKTILAHYQDELSSS